MTYLGHNSKIHTVGSLYALCDHIVQNMCDNKTPNVMLDLGALSGAGYVEFGTKYPNTKYIFVEPAPDRVEDIKNLMQQYPDANWQLIDGILGDEDSTVDLIVFDDPVGLSSNLYTDRNGKLGDHTSVEVKQYSYDILDEYEKIDIAKMNIEAAEYDLVKSPFFDKIQAFAMHCHNDMRPGLTYKNIVDELTDRYDLTTYGNLNHKWSGLIGIRKQ